MATNNTVISVVVAAGGTGGHLFPALAVVEQLRALTNDRVRLTFVGSADRMEATLIPSYGFDYTPMPIKGFKGLTHPSTLMLPWRILRSTHIARSLIRQHHADVVLATGAYISYPAGRAAIAEGVPLVLMESNVNPGKTNARLASKAAAVITSFDESRSFFPRSIQQRIHAVGNPVRHQILASHEVEAARLSFGLDPDRRTVLVFGGSLGARSINTAVQRMVDRWAASYSEPPWQLLWQTGKAFEATVPDRLASVVRVQPFINDMGTAYAAADLVVSRSGATTVAELGVVAKPAILIPLPSASTNEQHHNARVVEERGGALVVDDADLELHLSDTIEALMIDDRRRERMSLAMRTLGKPHAAEEAARIVLQCALDHQQHS